MIHPQSEYEFDTPSKEYEFGQYAWVKFDTPIETAQSEYKFGQVRSVQVGQVRYTHKDSMSQRVKANTPTEAVQVSGLR